MRKVKSRISKEKNVRTKGGGAGEMKCFVAEIGLFWFFGDFRCGALLFMVIHVIYKYKNK